MLTRNISMQIIRPRTMLTVSAGRIEAFKVTPSQKPSRLICHSFINDHGLDSKWGRERLEKLVINLAELLQAVQSSPGNNQLRQIVLSTNFLPEDDPVGINEQKRCAFIDLAHNIEEVECAPVILSHYLTSPGLSVKPIKLSFHNDITKGMAGLINFYAKERRIDLTKTLFRGMLVIDQALEIVLQNVFSQAVINGCTQLHILKSSHRLYPNLGLHLKNLKRVSRESLAEIRRKISTSNPKIVSTENFEEFEIISWYTVTNLAALAVIARKLGSLNYYTELRDMLFKDVDEDSSDNFVRDLAIQEFIELGLDQAGDYDSDIEECGHFARIPLLTSWQLDMAKLGFRQMFNYFECFFDQYYERLKI